MRTDGVADWLGVDVGWVHPAADSNGNVYRWDNQAHLDKARRDMTQASPVTIRRPDGTTRVEPAYTDRDLAVLIACSSGEFRVRCRDIGTRIARTAYLLSCGIALEDWSDDPRIHTRWRGIHQEIGYASKRYNVPSVWVPSAYTSQTCPDCGYCSEENRPERGRFQCQQCGTSGHADVIAARNIAARAREAYPPDPTALTASPEQKRCLGCGTIRERSEFRRNRTAEDGLVPRCKPCMRDAERKPKEWRRRHPALRATDGE